MRNAEQSEHGDDRLSAPEHWATALVRSLPRFMLSATVVVLLVTFVGLVVFAGVTERDVDFFPPHIGSGPKTALVWQVDALRRSVDSLRERHDDRMKLLHAKVAESRDGAERAARHNKTRRAECLRNEKKYLADIEREEKRFAPRFALLAERIDHLEARLGEYALLERASGPVAK